MKRTIMKPVLISIALILLVVGGILLLSSAFIVGEAEQALVLQFGRPVGEPITEPGLHFRTPFIQEVRTYDKRLISWDGDPNQIPTRGREFISIDTTARWRIVDALQFVKSVRDESGAQTRLDDIIDSVVRDKISSTELTEIVRSKDWNVTEKDLEEVEVVPLDDNAADLTKEIQVGRKTLVLNYIPSVRNQVFDRMISERQRIAEQFRSEGQGEASRIKGEFARELAAIRSEARRKAEVVRGEADAEATRIYNEAYSEDPEFYALLRTLESYPKTLKKNTDIIISSDSEYFRVLRNMNP